MIQYLIEPQGNLPVGKQISELLARGAGWITLRLPHDATVQQLADAITEAVIACLGSEAILVVDGHPEAALNTLVGTMRASGAVISADHGDPAAWREKLGPHAVLGYNAQSAAEILSLAGLDIDYFTLPASAIEASLADVETPIVATEANEIPGGFDGLLLRF